MSDDTTFKPIRNTGAGAMPSRRTFLGSVIVGGALASVPSSAFGRQDEVDERDLEIVAEFEPPSLPENIAIDDEGTVYLSMGPAGEIRAIDPDGTESTVAMLETGEEGLLLGITFLDGVLYAANASGESETHGVWRVEMNNDNEPEQIASLATEETMPNGIIPDPTASDALLISDHLGGAIWRVTTDGEAEQWISDPLLEPDMEAESPVGADGLAVHPDGDVYVDNLNTGSIIRVPVDEDNVGEPETIVQDEGLVGADGMTFDEEGSLYVAVNAENKIVRITPEQEIETLARNENLDFPADVHFGTTEKDATALYIANFAFGTFLEDKEAAEPSLAKIDVGVQGHFQETTDEERRTTDDEEKMGDNKAALNH